MKNKGTPPVIGEVYIDGKLKYVLQQFYYKRNWKCTIILYSGEKKAAIIYEHFTEDRLLGAINQGREISSRESSVERIVWKT